VLSTAGAVQVWADISAAIAAIIPIQIQRAVSIIIFMKDLFWRLPLQGSARAHVADKPVFWPGDGFSQERRTPGSAERLWMNAASDSRVSDSETRRTSFR
jgi:hypothetical protein